MSSPERSYNVLLRKTKALLGVSGIICSYWIRTLCSAKLSPCSPHTKPREERWGPDRSRNPVLREKESAYHFDIPRVSNAPFLPGSCQFNKQPIPSLIVGSTVAQQIPSTSDDLRLAPEIVPVPLKASVGQWTPLQTALTTFIMIHLGEPADIEALFHHTNAPAL